MTIGQRIAQKRKEHTLSQEALGERLGVSRQSIYKWESDAALPEIDKLVALAKLFGVTVGWLLGVEEPAAPQEQPPELTEQQLKLAEEIAERYIAALPKPVPPRRKRRFRLAAAGAALCLCGVLITLNSKLDRLNSRYDNLQNDLQNQISRVDRSVAGQIDSISNRVEEVLKSQNDLTADYGTEIKGADLEHGSITFSVYAVPKTYVEGMSATFAVNNGNGSNLRTVPSAIYQRFAAEVTCELTDSITLSVVFTYPDGTRQTQLLDQYDGLYTNSFPSNLDVNVYGDLFLPVENGTVTVPDLEVAVSDGSSTAAVDSAVGRSEVADIRVGLFRNKQLLAWAEPCKTPDWLDLPPDTGCFRFPETAVSVSGSDELRFAAVVTDEYDRTLVFSDVPYGGGSEGDQPTLTWPDSFDGSSSPDGWSW